MEDIAIRCPAEVCLICTGTFSYTRTQLCASPPAHIARVPPELPDIPGAWGINKIKLNSIRKKKTQTERDTDRKVTPVGRWAPTTCRYDDKDDNEHDRMDKMMCVCVNDDAR